MHMQAAFTARASFRQANLIAAYHFGTTAVGIR